MVEHLAFSYRSARSPALTTALCAIVVIESIAVHFALAVHHRWAAWILTLTSLAAVVWLVRDYRALGTGVVRLEEEALRLRVGRRFDITVSLARVARTLQPSFRDLPTPGTNEGRDYLNLTKPDAPNVLLVLETAQRVRLMAGLHRDVRRFALKLDHPKDFLRAADERRASLSTRSA